MSGLVVQDSIKVLTQNGVCRLDLCLGDITLLKQEDKVDVVMVSAFRASYKPSATSVIGSMKTNLGLDVSNLAKDKEEDLRKLYSCWWSKPLPDTMPYKRLMCFETESFARGRPQEQVANIYRCLVPILNNKDGTVITPLLNTGDQGYGKVSMLQGMVVAAINWMKAGLPLRLLKIVLYAKVVDGEMERINLKGFDDVCEKFAELKERYDSQYLIPKEYPIEYDIYLSFSKEDKLVADSIQEALKAVKPDIRIFGDKQEIDSEAVWQQDMYQVMRQSSRVVTVLSPNYLKSTECIEQYNIALCCNRRAHRDMLAPFYVDSVQLMPTYMGLVQYVDCRPNDTEKIQAACKSLLASMNVTVHREAVVVDSTPIQYDVFLSYCHKDDKIANHIVKVLQQLNPDLRIFFDIQELKTGKAWQRTLYHSIDGSRCLIALISKSYTKSLVCQEEYNLAVAKHCSGDGSLQLIPLCIEEMKEVPATFGKVKMTRATPDVFDSVSNGICKAVVSWLNGREVDANVECILKPDKSHTCNMDKVAEDKRRSEFTVKYSNEDKQLILKKQTSAAKLKAIIVESRLSTETESAPLQSEEGVADIVLSCAKEDWKYASFLKAVLKDTAPKLVVKGINAKTEKERLKLMDTARCVVAFLSPNYLDSPEHVEEFHVALCRQRISPTTVLFPITIHMLPQKPTYFHLVPSAVNITDELWMESANKWKVQVPVFDVLRTGRSHGITAEVALGLNEAAGILIEALGSKKNRFSLFSWFKTTDQSTAVVDPLSRPILHNVLTIHDDLKARVEIDKVLITLKI